MQGCAPLGILHVNNEGCCVEDRSVLRVKHELHHVIVPLAAHNVQQRVALPLCEVWSVNYTKVTNHLLAQHAHVSVGYPISNDVCLCVARVQLHRVDLGREEGEGKNT